MTNVFLNNLQLNDATITCNVTSTQLSKDYNNQKKAIYSTFSPLQYNTSGGTESYTFQFTLWGRGEIYNDLLLKQELIYNEIKNQVTNRFPLRILTNDTFIAANCKAVDCYVEDAEFDILASEGKQLLNFSLDCVIVKLLTDTDLNPPIFGWEAFSLGEGQVGDNDY